MKSIGALVLAITFVGVSAVPAQAETVWEDPQSMMTSFASTEVNGAIGVVVVVPLGHNYLAGMTFGMPRADTDAVASIREWDGTAPIGPVLFTEAGWGATVGSTSFAPNVEVTPGKSYFLYIHKTGVRSPSVRASTAQSGNFQTFLAAPGGWALHTVGIGARVDFRIRPTVDPSPFAPPVGTTVVVNGTGFTLATAVTIDGDAAAFRIVSDTQIEVTVLAGVTALPDLVVTGDDVPSVPVSLQVAPPPTVVPPVVTEPADTLTESGADLGMLPLGAAALALGALLLGFRRRTQQS